MFSIQRFLKILAVNGPLRTAAAIWDRLVSFRWHLPRRRLRRFRDVDYLFRGTRGLEIGGPSMIFSRFNLLPIYPIAAGIDNCNFARSTLWHGTVLPGATFVYDRSHSPGQQFICDAVTLSVIPSGRYDFLLSSHVIEHIANPLRALQEWKRVLKQDGAMVMVVPNRDKTFDKFRPVTTLDHLRHDLSHGTQEDDLTHLPEMLYLTRFALDTDSNNPELFRNNATTRAMHHHTFQKHTVAALLTEAGFHVIFCELADPYHIIALCTNTSLS
jgi:hypothetical protein